MKKKEVVREYNFSDAFLVQKCDDVKSSVTRDQTNFTDNGFTAADNTAFGDQRDAFSAFPTDDELDGDVTDTTETKDASAEAVRVSIRMFRTAAENKWTVHKAKYRKYGFEGMDEMTDAELVRLGRRVSRVATEQLADIGGGITSTKITAHDVKVNDFDRDIDLKVDAVKDRDNATEDRIELGNALFNTMQKVCKIGQNIWETTDEAKFNDYLIYNTKSGGEEPPPPTPPV